MAAAAPDPQTDRSDHRLAVGLFLALLGFHGWAVSVGWTSLNLPGGEFRQAQTAITALFVQQEDNYALAYPTPVLASRGRSRWSFRSTSGRWPSSARSPAGR